MMIHFIRPYWLLAIFPVISYLILTLYLSRQNNPWRKLCDPHLLPALLQSSPRSPRWFLNVLLLLLLSLTIFALAGPSWNKAKLPVYRDISSMMIVLDLSASMEASDLKPDRLTRAKLKIRDLINLSKNTQMGLIAFSNEAFVATPLSQDATTLHAILEELSPQMMPISGSDIGEGLKQGLNLLTNTSIPHCNVLLITASEPTASSWSIAKAIRDAGHQLNILATLSADNNTNQTLTHHLGQLAQMGGGHLYTFTADDHDIKAIINTNHALQAMKDDNVENTMLWHDAGPWFCLLLLPLALLVLRIKAV